MRAINRLLIGLILLGMLTGCSEDGLTPHEILVARGNYLVEHISACGDCHTPRDMAGQLDRTRWLAGVAVFADLDPGDPMWVPSARRT